MIKDVDSKNKEGFFQRLCKPFLASDSTRGDVANQAEPSSAGADGVSSQASGDLICLRIEPASEETRSQSLLAARSIEQPIFTIGRRSGSVGRNPDETDFSIRQVEPYTVSRRHCVIERASDHVLVKDLGGKFGILVNDKRVGGSSSAPESIKLTKGVHQLTLGPRESVMRFNLIVG